MAEALHAAASPPPRHRPRPDRRSAPRPASSSPGRRTELRWLDERLKAALSGAGSVVFVTGERGIGKTALVGEMLRRVRAAGGGVTVVAGRCLERQGPGEALQPFLDAMGRLFGTSRGREHAVELVKTWAPTVGVLMPAALVPDPDGSLHRQTAGATRERLIRESGDFMEAATRLYPDGDAARGLPLGRPDERGAALPPRAPQRAPAHPDPLHVPAPRRSRRRTPTCTGHARPAHGRARPRARARPARRRGRRAMARPALPGERLRAAPRAGAAGTRRGAAALRAQPGGAARRARRHRARRGRLPPGSLARRAGPRALEGRHGPRARTPRDAARSRPRAAGGGERPRQGVLERHRARRRRRRRARGRGAPAAPVPREPRAREPRRGGPAGRHARHPLPLRPRPLPAGPLRGPGRPAPRRAPPARRRAAAALLGRERAHSRRARWPSTSSAAATSRAPCASGRSPASTPRAASPAPRPSITTRPACSSSTSCRRTSCDRSRWRSTAAVPSARLLLARFDDAARDYEAMLARARAARLPAAECEALSGLCNAHFFEQRHDRDDGARPRGAAGRRAPRLAAPPGGGARPCRAGARDGGPAEGGRRGRSTR